MATQIFHGKVIAEPGATGNELATKTQLDTAESNAKMRANHTGTQTAATISDFQTSVETIVTTLLDLGNAPAALNTLNEIAAAIGDDADYAGTITAQITALDGRIDTLESAPPGDAEPDQFTLAAGTSSVVTHSKARRVIVQVIRISDGQQVFPVITGNNAASNTVTIDFGTTSIAADSHVALVL